MPRHHHSLGLRPYYKGGTHPSGEAAPKLAVAISRRQERWVLWLGLQIPERTGGHGDKLTDHHQQNNDVTTTIVTTEQLIGDSPFKPHYWAELPCFAALALDLSWAFREAVMVLKPE